MEVILTCPLGSVCEEAKGGAIYRCAWYDEVKGKNPQDGTEINEWRCSHSWATIIGLENNKHVLSGVAATEQVRNILADMAKGG